MATIGIGGESFNKQKRKNRVRTSTKVLLIEDNLDIRENLTEILELDGYIVLAAPNGKIGLKLAKEKLPDIILCDIKMPGLNGYEVLLQVKKNVCTANIVFIFITSSVEKKEVQSALEMGADGYIFKPFGLEELLIEIEHSFENKSLALDRSCGRNQVSLNQ